MRAARLVLIAGLLASTLACGSSPEDYRADRGAPDLPAFVVVPHDRSADQQRYADLVEQAVMRLGFEVYRSPGNLGAGQTGGETDSEMVERYLKSERLDASHIILTYGRAYHAGAKYRFIEAHIKIVERRSKRMLYSRSIGPYEEARYLAHAFLELGFPMKEAE